MMLCKSRLRPASIHNQLSALIDPPVLGPQMEQGIPAPTLRAPRRWVGERLSVKGD